MTTLLLVLLGLVAAGGLGVFAIWWSSPPTEARRLLAEVPEKRIPELAEGERARIRGIARRGGELKTALVTQRRCIGFRLVIDGSERDRAMEWDEGDQWVAGGEWVDCAAFELVADGAAARVEGTVLMGMEFDTYGGDGATPLKEAELGAINRLCPGGRASSRSFSEAILQDGDRIWVLGRPSLVVDPRGLRDSSRGQPMLPVFRGTPQDPVVLARDG